MRFVCLRSAGCVRAGDMMRERERERERCCDTGADTRTQLGPGHSTVQSCTVYCAEHPRLAMKKVTRMTDIIRCDQMPGIRGMMDGVRDWSD